LALESQAHGARGHLSFIFGGEPSDSAGSGSAPSWWPDFPELRRKRAKSTLNRGRKKERTMKEVRGRKSLEPLLGGGKRSSAD